MNWGECQVSEWQGAPQMETGAPMPGIASDGRQLLVAYIVRDGGAVETFEECYAVVSFSGVLQHTFGYPNEDVLSEHPLYSLGLEAYAFNEIANSPYVGELAARNARAFPESKARYLKHKHWIVTFHDETLEVVANAVEFLGTVGARSAVEAIEKMSNKTREQ